MRIVGPPEIMPQGAPPDSVPTRIGAATARLDGRAKVTGAALYGSDFIGERELAYAFLLTSAIAKGRISDIQEREARKVPGVQEIFTFRNVGKRINAGKTFADKGYMGSTIAPLQDDRIHHSGQIVAMVVADSFEAARESAHRLRIRYSEDHPTASFGDPGTTDGPVHKKTKEGSGEDDSNPKVGDAEGAFARAKIKLDHWYETPTQHHNPIELFTTTADWSGDRLTIWESSQNVYGCKFGVAGQLGIDPANVHVVSPFIGGAFGSRGSLTQRTAIVAHAARVLGRPVRLEPTRSNGFTIATYRAETRHRIRLAASSDGKLEALIHEGWEITSRPDDYKVAGTDASTRLYACPNVNSNVTIVHADRNTPGFMRSPPEVPYLFALESAMDELAVELRMDPVELRRVNDTTHEPIKGLPYTSRALMPCFDAAAKAFGWASRNPEPSSMREGDWLIGWGCSSTMYPTQVAPAAARVSLSANGEARVQSATHEIGNGIFTALALIVVDELGVPLERVRVEVGDTDLPPAPVAGGSNSTASVCNVVAKACRQIRDRIVSAAIAANDSPFHGRSASELRLESNGLVDSSGRSEPLSNAIGRTGGASIEVYAENVPHGVPPEALQGLHRGKPSLAGGAHLKDRIQFAFGAQFVEVRVNRRTREIRAPRIVSAFAAGRIVNPKTAKSQLMGGQIWGISSALHEATEIDHRSARYTNDDLAEYLVPVNADIDRVETIFIPEQDLEVNELGIKGLGELGNVGLNAAVANAVYHATGVRIRELPIRIEKLMNAPAIA